MIIYKSTSKIIIRNMRTGEVFICTNKSILSQMWSIPLTTIQGWFRKRPEDKAKPSIVRQGEWEVMNVEGEYRNEKAWERRKRERENNE